MKIDWLKEVEAAEKLGIKPETLRRYCKAFKLPINWRATNGRNFQYSKQDLEKFMIETSTLTA